MRKRMLLLVLFSVVITAASSSARAGELQVLAVQLLKFSLKNTGGIKLFESLSGKKFECGSVSGAGEFTGERVGVAEFKFKECKDALLVTLCTGLSDTSGNISFKVTLDIRHLLPNSEGIDIAVLLGSVHFSCLGVLVVVSGCLASGDLVTKTGGEGIVNKLVEKALVPFSQEKGDQKITSIDTDSSLGMEECVPKLKQEAGENQSAGSSMEIEMEKFELGPAELLVALTGTL